MRTGGKSGWFLGLWGPGQEGKLYCESTGAHCLSLKPDRGGCLGALLKDLSYKCAEVGSGKQELGCREVVGVAVASVQLSSGDLDQVETLWQREDRSTEGCYQVEPVEEEMGIRAAVGVLLEQLGRWAFPTLPSVVPSCRGECSRAAETPSWKHPVPL